MQGKVVLEEHFAIPETLQDSAGFAPEADWPELKGRLLDIQERRLREMDAHGIEMMLLSLNAPAVQAIADLAKANDIARRSNDFPRKDWSIRASKAGPKLRDWSPGGKRGGAGRAIPMVRRSIPAGQRSFRLVSVYD